MNEFYLNDIFIIFLFYFSLSFLLNLVFIIWYPKEGMKLWLRRIRGFLVFTEMIHLNPCHSLMDNYFSSMILDGIQRVKNMRDLQLIESDSCPFVILGVKLEFCAECVFLIFSCLLSFALSLSVSLCLMSKFHGISIFVGYLMLKPLL